MSFPSMGDQIMAKANNISTAATASGSAPLERLPFKMYMLKKYGLTMANLEFKTGIVLAEPPDAVRCFYDVFGEIEKYDRYRKDCNSGTVELYEDILDHIFNMSFQREQAILLLEYLGHRIPHDLG